MYYSIVNYSQHAVHYIPRTYSSYNWKSVPFDHCHPSSPHPSPWKPPIYSVSMSSVTNMFFKKKGIPPSPILKG